MNYSDNRQITICTEMTAKIALETLHQSYSKFVENRFTQVKRS